jgi:arylsulfatase A-like enzyme
MKTTLTIVSALLLVPLAALHAADAPKQKPNIIVILADDLGYADLGCQGSKEVLSPQIDSIAANGVRCTAGYVSAPQCCPSRAGLITGRYQNRFGFEANWPGTLSGKAGLPVSERTIADRLKAAGYVTGMIGKWHLGESEAMRPYNRGFDEAFWHPNGGVLFTNKKTGFLSNLYRGAEPVQEKEYSTDAFGREACAFIDRHQREPFFLYLAFVPPHWPMEAKPEHLAQYAHIPDLHRRTMLGMMASLDENVGRVLAKLRETQQEENTLVFFLSDNGGPTGRERPQPDADFEYGQNTSKNEPCRGVKGELLEGGIRVPFLAQWKGHIPAGRTYDHPVISLDILPTALAVAGVEVRPDWKLDGTDLLPFLTGGKTGAPHDTLCWRFRFPPAQPALYRWAIRQGDWKLVKNGRDPVALYDLGCNMGETNNLAEEHPERVAKMKAAYEQWDAQNKEPLWTDDPVPLAAMAASAIIRGTRHVKAEVLSTEIRVECTGHDPQLIFSDIPGSSGPFTLELKIKSASKGPGQIFWSTAATPEFTPAQSVTFDVQHDGVKWHDYTVKISETTQPVTHLRLDPGNAPGLVRIACFVLKDKSGKVVKAWMGTGHRQGH